MKRKFLAALCALVMLVSVMPSAAALSDEELRAAEKLHMLSLVNGTGTSAGYALDAVPTRAHAVAVIVRLAGYAAEAQTGSYEQPFTDVPAWVAGSAALAFHKGWVTSGTTATTFSPQQPVTANDYFTILLRMLGYSDANGDFDPSSAALFARRIGLTTQEYTSDDFTRGDMFCITADALPFRYKDSDDTVIQRLLDRGAVTYIQALSVGLLNSELTARQIYDRCSAAVFQLDCWSYKVRDTLQESEPTSNATGFFIDSTGIAVTNYHSIESCVHAVVTLVTGEQYPVEKILYFDNKIDIAVLQISRTATDGTLTSAFAHLELPETDDVRAGDVAYAISNPLGLGLAISSGIISDPERPVERYELPCVMSTAPISQGSSGGALLNAYGQVIAITSGAYVYGNEMYLAVPVVPALDADLIYMDCTLAQYYMDLPFLDLEE